MRQIDSSGTAVIRLLSSGSERVLPNPDRLSVAWQWVSLRYDLTGDVTNLTIQLALDIDNELGRAYFDDICVTGV